MKTKKILLLGGSHRDIPLIKAAQELGYFVITLGAKDYYKGHRYSDQYFLIDFNDLEKVKQIIKDKQIDYLLPGCGEESYLNTVKLSQELNIGNFDDLEVAKLVHNKWQFKQFCLKNNVCTPNGFYYKKEQDISKLNFPIVVKPTNLSGGRGVDIVQNQEQLNTSIKDALKVSNDIFLEEYIQGRLIAYSVFIQNQKIVYAFSGADDTYLNPYLITTAYPIKLDTKVEQRLIKDINTIAQKLNFVDGMFHLQIIIKDNLPYIIDVTRRIPGDFYPYLIEKSDEVQYSKAVVKAYIGDTITDEFKNKANNFIIRHVVMPERNGVYQGLVIDDKIQNNIIFRFDLISNGYKIINYLNTQITILFIKSLNIYKNDINKAIKIKLL